MSEFNKHLLGGKNELRNWSFEKLTADPAGANLYSGRFWLDTVLNVLKYYDGTAVQSLLNDDGITKVTTDTTSEPSGSDQVLNIVSLTQAEYDAGSPVATTLYIITDA